MGNEGKISRGPLSPRVVNTWNALLEKVVDAVFKTSPSEHLNHLGIEGHGQVLEYWINTDTCPLVDVDIVLLSLGAIKQTHDGKLFKDMIL